MPYLTETSLHACSKLMFLEEDAHKVNISKKMTGVTLDARL
jgi:hypothetical protein